MRLRYLLIPLAALATLFIFIEPAWAFDLSKGIVGNLDCAESGNCNFCDFIQLFVVLQKVILSLFGSLAIIMLIWGGQGIITAAGNQQKVAEAKKLIVSTLLGVLIILVSYFLIVILVALLVTPAGSKDLKTKDLFGSNWTNAFCTASDDASYCGNKDDGSSCTVTTINGNGAGICKNGTCITQCQYEWGDQGYSCRDSTSCTAPAVLYLCPGPNNIVCCK